ncbi:MAG: cyanophycinase-like protein [Ferruginibacter sp.]|uniref:cyanophycinase n=1 Tax=Ferruginibacter sp. TaxID=1940288 RepID=UPI00265876E4|nr:cyanophycinase [Ferruginibacter sp.]MDB5276706.1 cyanophycinase-like protein [Ferruginibacter sp.]
MQKQSPSKLLLLISLGVFFSCAKQTAVPAATSLSADKSAGNALKPVSSVVTYLTGDAADVTTSPTAGLILMGGGTDVDAAIKWFLQRAGGGDVVVIRATGADGYNQYMYDMVGVNSVETIIIDSRAKADLAEVTQKIRNAEALFIAGGDQWDYINYWKNTGTEDAINYLINTKKVTVGGTSAGLAVMGSIYYSAQTGSVTSAQALKDPYHKYITLGQNDFIATPLLQNTITDSHYTQRDRQGRHITFLARMMKDFAYANIKGIGIDEQTAVCIDQTGAGKVYGINQAYFLQNETLGAETCISGIPLTWNRSGLAVKAYKISASLTGNGSFNATNWTLGGGTAYHYYVNNGVLVQN